MLKGNNLIWKSNNRLKGKFPVLQYMLDGNINTGIRVMVTFTLFCTLLTCYHLNLKIQH